MNKFWWGPYFLTEYVRLKLEKHWEYLDVICEKGFISKQTAIISENILFNLFLTNKFIMPTSSTGPEGRFMLCWDKNEHHLEIEIFSTNKTEIFYRNRITEKSLNLTYAKNLLEQFMTLIYHDDLYMTGLKPCLTPKN